MPEPRKQIIIFSAFYEPYLSGAERFVKEVVERLGPRCRFVLFTARISPSLPTREERPWGEIRRLGFGHSSDKWIYPILAPLAALRIRSEIAHAVMESYAGVALWLFGIFRPRTKRILTLQSGDLDQKKIPSWLWRRIHASPSLVTAISGYLAERAVRIGQPRERVRVIPNGYDPAEADEVRRERLSRVLHRIVCVARLSPEKGIEALLRSLVEVRKSVLDAHLVLVGDGVLRAELENQTSILGLSDAVTFLGALPHQEALRQIARGEVFACPSLAEGLGIVFIEAQAVGTPAIGTRVGGIPDVIEDGRTGLLIPSADPSALAEAILRIFRDPESAGRMAVAAEDKLGRFDWNRIAAQVAEIYERGGEKKKIVIATGIYPPEIGGPATYSRTLAAGLARREWKVNIISYGDPSVPRDVPDGAGLRIVSRAGGLLVRYIRYALTVFRESRDADLVYLLDPVSSGLPGTIAAIARRKPTVLKVVGDYAWEQGQARGLVKVLLDEFQKMKAPASVELFRMIQRRVVRRASCVVVPSRYLAGIVRQWGVAEERVAVIPNAVHLPRSSAAEIPAADRPPIVISAGRFLPWKGMETLVRCFPEVRRRFPDARLVLVGDGPARPEIERAVREVNGQTWVELPGRLPQEKLHEMTRQSAVFVLVSGYEGFSHQIIEAMALGTPVVASDAGGNPEAIRDGENGVLVPYGDAGRTASAIIGLLADRSRAATLAAAAREDAKQYTEERMVEATARLFHDIGE
ncbi:hypothetical protein A3F28_00765 [Candidatus Uhrbacteria bacterium RIFCSPHIGHO2_12_FULL_57_11]|uniref:Glycosyltransferase subfamily 4-like N-terminal domain-containing protein n=2 Tax=Candidatus Uhriibacteriota TaxID=1752732 RepID=A0A1F7UND5_9BACT|nr:MAG: hypothetical protein A3D72_01840 [Candidatus Uhrbacteria bacterium RIFCSPHIGHO2_02_FULL_57_19]OGL79207.1 MAG: hypothetical protein A3F28_00765 [Candidatus Uhrbacteria bacterium RIFCSPHIGHO2_12_FULL_57_11]